MKFFRARDPAEIRQVTSGSTTQNLCLKDRRVRSRVGDTNRWRISRRGAVGKVRGGGGRSGRISNKSKVRIDWLRISFKRDEHISCHALGLVLATRQEA